MTTVISPAEIAANQKCDLFALIFQEIKHASEMIKTHQEQQLLIKFIDEKNIIFYGQRDSILDLEDEMHDLKMQNTEQGLFIQKIIYLRYNKL